MVECWYSGQAYKFRSGEFFLFSSHAWGILIRSISPQVDKLDFCFHDTFTTYATCCWAWFYWIFQKHLSQVLFARLNSKVRCLVRLEGGFTPWVSQWVAFRIRWSIWAVTPSTCNSCFSWDQPDICPKLLFYLYTCSQTDIFWIKLALILRTH